ncbi:MAG: hypothetical protein V1668_00945 [Patescibacteria group bacterium]
MSEKSNFGENFQENKSIPIPDATTSKNTKQSSFFSLPFLEERPTFKKIVVLIWIITGILFALINYPAGIETIAYAAGGVVGIFLASLLLSIIPILILRHKIEKVSSLIFGIISIAMCIILILGSINTN